MVEVFEDSFYSNQCMDDDEKHFHSIIGHIEDILMDPGFLKMHVAFMEKYWHEFEDTEENKFIYTDIFNEYIATIERHLENELVNHVPNFNMSEFEAELKARQGDLDGEVFEILETFSDFSAFKTMFLDYKNMKEGKAIDFSADLCISKCNTQADAASKETDDDIEPNK